MAKRKSTTVDKLKAEAFAIKDSIKELRSFRKNPTLFHKKYISSDLLDLSIKEINAQLKNKTQSLKNNSNFGEAVIKSIESLGSRIIVLKEKIKDAEEDRIIWLEDELLLKKLYQLLLDEQFICKCGWVRFASKFKGDNIRHHISRSSNEITWRLEQNQLLKFFDILAEHGLVPRNFYRSNGYQLLKTNFDVIKRNKLCNEKHTNLKNHQLLVAHTSNSFIQMPKEKISPLENLIKQISKLPLI